MKQLDEKVLVGGQIRPSDVAGLKQLGVTMIVNNRPDGEEAGQPLGARIEEEAEKAGIEYRFVPIYRGIGPADVESMQEAFEACKGEGKCFAFCRSGNRSALAWALARREDGWPREKIEARAAEAGVDLAPIAHLL